MTESSKAFKRKMASLTALGLLLGVYAASYLILSLNGSYEAESVSLKGVQWWSWAPKGFASEKGWNHAMAAIYFPLCVLDVKLWHKSVDFPDGRYPVNREMRWDEGSTRRAK